MIPRSYSISAVKASHKVSHYAGNNMKFLHLSTTCQLFSANKLSLVPCSHGLIGQTVPGSTENLKISIFLEMFKWKTMYWKFTCQARHHEGHTSDCNECAQCTSQGQQANTHRLSVYSKTARHPKNVYDHTLTSQVTSCSELNLTFSLQFILCFIKANIPSRLFSFM